jgi:uncharacterized protein YqgV (UPF0045/DUF77 family)
MQINAAIQLLPLVTDENRYDVVDKAISLINDSGLHYKVCPFETVLEGNSDKVYALIRNIQETILRSGCEELILNIKIHAANRDLAFEEKLEKY